MSAAPSSSPRSSRARNAAVVVALVAVGLAARNGAQPAQATPPQPPASAAATLTPASATPTAVSADSAAPQDSVTADSLAVQDSLAPMVTDSIQPDQFVAAAAAAPAAWPVDPVTGQTLINGRPVVGRVFIMQKTDGTVKYPNVADVISHEALEPLPPVVGTSHTPAPLAHTRRMRGIMVQSTLWSIDTKRSAVERRHYRVSTPAPLNGQ